MSRYRPEGTKEEWVAETWRDVVAALAGTEGAMRLVDGADFDAKYVAEVSVPGLLLRSRGDSEQEAWRDAAHRLGDFRLVQLLEAAGWTDIDEVIDQVTYVVARDRHGALWAIGVAANDGDRRGYIESDIEYHSRTFDRIAFVDPVDTRDWPSLEAALGAST